MPMTALKPQPGPEYRVAMAGRNARNADDGIETAVSATEVGYLDGSQRP